MDNDGRKKQVEHIYELQARSTELRKRLAQLQQQIGSLERESRINTISLNELRALSGEHRQCYRALGRAFVRTPPPDLSLALERESGRAADTLQTLRGLQEQFAAKLSESERELHTLVTELRARDHDAAGR